ncbi:S8 family serine peptidase [Fluoribacter dumoffii]|uniref:Extracellular basic protease n=1 Tax=Fluoribacter dumoffii TaxID=463 RepID=A0A377GBY1_9GAMM|nr:S8 family serine peptidase [Fluoribacter dumoffii]KTC90634.1 serine protease [Fluoribacter dumoffii NY 23]MCW8386314.1 S8 family serine peptidase [Fluoribacter dumoffii]MCW8419367.1 S8 family serine peptidase [Fluoribacter dumoffii]MCW8452758.1 S8 family serine peptidase [Fluoribacter dumoffii]MCW8459992.1 S8 family serine peptidase [Fluoribacter dumoffii]
MLKSGIAGLGLLTMAHCVFALPEQNTIRVIIKYKEQITSVSSLKSQIKQQTHLPVKEFNPMANGAFLLILDAAQSPLAKSNDEDEKSLILERLRKNPQVLYAVEDRISYFKPVPDPEILDAGNLLSHESQWDEFARPAGIMLESAPGFKDGAWAYTTGLSKKPVVVAVLDTGIALNDSLINNLVKDRVGNLWGWNFAGNNNNLIDETRSYHGTHVAGTIAGYGSVMNGMGEDLKILPLKIPAANGMFYESSVINAIYWAVGGEVPGVPTNIHPAQILNMSFGVDRGPKDEIDYCDQALQEAVFFARKKGAVLAVAAGNDNVWEHFNAPAVCNGTIKVASTGPEGLRSYFSNYGPSITLAAPGGDKRYGTWGGILSTVNPGGGYNGSGFDFYQGTSMATPHVAGVAGLIFAASETPPSPEQVEQLLYTTTHDFGVSSDPNKSCVGKKPCGHGILDAENAVKAAVAGYDLVFSAPKMEHLAVRDCGKNTLIPSKSHIISEGGIWIRNNTVCETSEHFHKPHIKNENGSIIAAYGSVSYRLDLSAYKSCQIIGYDGVGCYL